MDFDDMSSVIAEIAYALDSSAGSDIEWADYEGDVLRITARDDEGKLRTLRVRLTLLEIDDEA